MNKAIVVILTGLLLMGGIKTANASDWDKAGIALTAIEGLRILTGGRVDVVGTFIGAGKSSDHHQSHKAYGKKHPQQYAKHYQTCATRVWVPHFEWHKEHVPAHEEYDEHLGKIFVEEHYIKYQVESGGHWEEAWSCYN